MKMLKKLLCTVALSFSLSTSLYAQVDPVAMMQGVANKMITALEANKSQLKKKGVVSRIVNNDLVPYVNTGLMSAAVVGRQYWGSATPSQKTQFIHEFKSLVIATYSDALSSYDGDVVRFYPLREDFNHLRVTTVNSVIKRRSGQEIPISYNLIASKNGWSVYDFSIENISMVRSYHSQFAGVLANGGMPALLKRLQSHNQQV